MILIAKEKIKELLKLKSDNYLYHREGSNLEFKEQFNFAGLAEYLRDFAAFANNTGGYIIFGVSNSPRKLIGLTEKSIEQFEKIDPEQITGSLLEIFSPNIQWSQQMFGFGNKKFGVFYVQESRQKPVIAQKDEGRDNLIKSGDIFFRYAGRTQRIEYAELSYIIEQRIKCTNDQWMSLMSKISKAGPANAAILDTERGLIEKSKDQVLVIDEDLINKIKFIKEGQFKESEGATTLKLVGEVQPIGAVEVARTIHKKLIDLYPLSASKLFVEVKKQAPDVGKNSIFEIIKSNNLKKDPRYSAYNFRNKTQEEEYLSFGKVPSGVPSIYNSNAVNFILKVIHER